jgi:hypothetical protein
MNATQETKLVTARAFASELLAGNVASFNNAIDSKSKDKVVVVANAILSQNDELVALAMVADLNQAYKSAVSKTVKDKNSKEIAERVRIQKMVCYNGAKMTGEILNKRLEQQMKRVEILEKLAA